MANLVTASFLVYGRTRGAVSPQLPKPRFRPPGSRTETYGENCCRTSLGRHKSLLLLDRDVQRNMPVQFFEQVMQKRAGARTLMFDVVPTTPGLRPKEIMSYGDLIAAKSSLHQLPRRRRSDCSGSLKSLRQLRQEAADCAFIASHKDQRMATSYPGL